VTKIRLKIILALLVLAALAMPAVADEMSEEDVIDVVTVEFTGVAVELYVGEMPGAPTIWVVYVPSDEGDTICSDIINVTVYQATPQPWGTCDESVTIGDAVEVYGAYVEDETGCIVTLQGSEDYYFELAEEGTEVVDEVEVDEGFDQVEFEEEPDEVEFEEEPDEVEFEDDETWGEEEIFDCTCRDVAWGDSWTDKSKEQPL
jgi:hypothetical protein